MNVKKTSCVLAAVAISTLSVSASAEGDKYSWKGRHYGHHYGNYYECYTTPAVEFPGTIVDAAVATDALSTLVTAVVAADLVDALSSEGPFTVYAPTNDAFAAIPEGLLGAILADTDLLTSILTYHVTADVKPHYDPRWVNKNAFEVPTLNGQTVFYNRNGGPQINNANASCQPVKTSNGVVFVIDSVLLPQFIQAPEAPEEAEQE